MLQRGDACSQRYGWLSYCTPDVRDVAAVFTTSVVQTMGGFVLGMLPYSSRGHLAVLVIVRCQLMKFFPSSDGNW